MAIYHLHGQVIKRSAGKTVVASAAYRRATKLYDKIAEKNWDYSKKENVVHSEILIPENAPDWAQELISLHQNNPADAAEKLWNFVEACEKRKDAQLAREIEFALPHELSLEQNILLAREFIQDQFVLRGMIADWSVHWDEGNPHVHVMLTMREIIEKGFGHKVREWNQKELLVEWRSQWAQYANFHLRKNQHDVKIDHRSYEAQGIELVPTIHQGKAVTDMDRRGIQTNIMQEANGIRRENLSRISKNPEILLEKLSQERESFTHQHVGQELGRYINDRGKFSVPEASTEIAKISFNKSEKGILSEAILKELNSAESPSLWTPDHIASILKSIEHFDSVFSEKTIAKTLSKITHNAEDFAKALIQVKGSPEILYLGPGDDGRDRFTTRRMFRLENEIQSTADALRDRQHLKIASKKIQKILERYQEDSGKKFTDEQIVTIKHILAPSSLRCVVGRAGTGKSFSLGAAKAIWESQGLRVQGVTLSGIAADGLSKDVGIPSRTIESFRYALEQGKIQLNRRDVLVMDEAGMTDSISMQVILVAVNRAKAKLVLVGDPAQIQPVGPGASFRALVERVGFAELQMVYRQEEEWQRQATVAFSAGRISEGLNAYDAKGCIHFGKNEDEAMALLVDDWMKRKKENPDLSRHLVMAYRNKDVKALNELIRQARIQEGEISPGYSVNTTQGEIKIAQGDRILFLKNDRFLGVSNGRLATVESVKFSEAGRAIEFSVRLDGNAQTIFINPKQYQDFMHGYASTVHKAQGVTVDHSSVFVAGFGWIRHLSYVALSRHRKSCHLYVDQGKYQDLENLKRALSKFGMKDSVLDFPLAFAQRRGIHERFLEKIIPEHLMKRLKNMKENLTNNIQKNFYPDAYYDRLIREAQEKLKIEKIAQDREEAKIVASYVDAIRAVKLSKPNFDVSSRGEGSLHLRETQSKISDAHPQHPHSTTKMQSVTMNEPAFPFADNQNNKNGSDSPENIQDQSTFTAYSSFQKHFIERNSLAHKILQNPSAYEKVLEIYGINENQLKRHADKHTAFERAKNYFQMDRDKITEGINKLAHEISKNIKSHYFSLKHFKIDFYDLKKRSFVYEKANKNHRSFKSKSQKNGFDLDNKESINNKAHPTKLKIKNNESDFVSTLKKYVDMELQLENLTDRMFKANPSDPGYYEEYASPMMKYTNKINQFSDKALKIPSFKNQIDKILSSAMNETISEINFEKIQLYLNKGKLPEKDLYRLAAHLIERSRNHQEIEKEHSKNLNKPRDLYL